MTILKSRTALFILIGLITYFLIITTLVMAESASLQSPISSYSDAIRYSISVVTTGDYGTRSRRQSWAE